MFNIHNLSITEIRKSTTASSETTPTHSHLYKEPTKPLKSTMTFTKLKTLSSLGEWIFPEKRHFYEDLNVIFSEDPNKFLGVFHTEYYKITRKFIQSQRHGVQLYYTRIEPNHKIKAQIAIIHGFGEHSGRYLTFADFFAKKGFMIHLIDLGGFGYSGGPKCSSTLEEFHQDISSLVGQVEVDIPLFMMGQGFGAGLMLSFLLINTIKLAGVITTAALIETHHLKSYNFAIRWALEALSEDYGDLCFNAKLNPTSLCKNNFNIRKYVNDPLLTPFVSLKMLKSVSDLLSYVMPNAHKFNYPVLIVHGSKDVITNPEDSLKFYRKISSKDKSYKIFEEGYHQLHEDNEMNNLQKCIYQWCKPRALKSKAFNGVKNLVFGIPKKRFLKKRFVFIAIFLLFRKESKIYLDGLKEIYKSTSEEKWFFREFICDSKHFHSVK